MTTAAITLRPAFVSGRARLTAVVSVTLVNSVLYLVARALGTEFQLTDPGKTEAHQMTLLEIAFFTAFFALLGWGTLSLLHRVTRHAKAVWTVLAFTVLALSLVLLGIEQATFATKAMLFVIHIAVVAAVVPMLRTRS